MPNTKVIQITQQWLLERMDLLTGVAKEEGACHGLGQMALQAILAEDLPSFENRLRYLYEMPLAGFVEQIESLKVKRLALINEVKAKHGLPRELSAKEMADLGKNERMQQQIARLMQKIEDLIKEGKLKESEKAVEFARRKHLFLEIAFMQKIIEEAKLVLSEEERLKLDTPIFFDGIRLHQNIYNFAFLFPDGYIPRLQNNEEVLPLIMPNKLEELGGVAKVTSFSGIYTVEELTLYFDSLNQALQEADAPLVLVLNNVTHSMVISYDPKEKAWIYVNANRVQIPLRRFSSSKALANEIIEGFQSTNGIEAFATEMYVKTSAREAASATLEDWQSQAIWKKLHEVTPEKANRSNSHNLSWLHVAAKSGHASVVNDLLKLKARVNLAAQDGITPLVSAVTSGHHDIVKMLLASSADPNKTTKSGWSPLHIATLNQNKPVIDLLLAYAADPNLINETGLAPLYLAVRANNVNLVAELLNHKADPNKLFMGNKVTALFIAAQNGQHAMVKLLLANGADPRIPFTSTIESLDNFAKSTNVVAAMDAMIKKKHPYMTRLFHDAKISLTPAEIATVMGHKDIAALLDESMKNLKRPRHDAKPPQGRKRPKS